MCVGGGTFSEKHNSERYVNTRSGNTKRYRSVEGWARSVGRKCAIIPKYVLSHN
jgi:hypothetical protein